MKLFRTEIKPAKIFAGELDWKSKFTALGSCFAENISSQFNSLGVDIISNPIGILYNPESIANFISNSINKIQWTDKDLISYENKHYFPFVQNMREQAPQFLNSQQDLFESRLKSPGVICITFGTAWAYRLKSNQRTVANCQKLPSKYFERSIIELEKSLKNWSQLIKKIDSINPETKWIFTISPVRHLRDNYRDNQISKSLLHLLVDGIVKNQKNCHYFPSYEIMMDDLRDYRFYKDDMTHPNQQAIDYIFDKFISSAFSEQSCSYFAEAAKILAMQNHKLIDPTSEDSQKFLESLQNKLKIFQGKYPESKLY